MNKIEINTMSPLSLKWYSKCKKFINKVLNKLGKKNWEVSVLFCNNDFIKKLNKTYRNQNKSTDVLAFPQQETLFNYKKGKGQTRLAGDIVISLEMLEANAKKYGLSENDELKRLLIHGILHLDGQDHSSCAKADPMLILQEDLAIYFKGEDIL